MATPTYKNADNYDLTLPTDTGGSVSVPPEGVVKGDYFTQFYTAGLLASTADPGSGYVYVARTVAGATSAESISTDGDVTVGEDLAVTGETALGDILEVDGAVTFNSTLDVIGATTVDDLAVGGDATVTGNVTVAGDIGLTLSNAAGNITVERGDITVTEGDVTVTAGGIEITAGGLIAGGASDLADVSITGSLVVPVESSEPASASATGTAGTVVFGADGYLYFCTATDTWIRVQLQTWV